MSDQGGDDDLVQDDEETLRPGRRPESVGDLVRAAVGRRGWSDRVAGASIFGRWEEVVGPELSNRCEPAKLAGGLLVVRAESQAWATQVTYLAPAIIERAQEVLGPHLVRDMKVIVGRLTGVPGTRPETGQEG